MPVAHTQVPMLHGCGPLGRELWPMALSQILHEAMTFRYVLRTDRAAGLVLPGAPLSKLGPSRNGITP
jgi:hypothetical protein